MADQDVRIAAFEWLRRMVDMHGDILPRPLLASGFDFQGLRVPLVSPQGIFKPQVCDLPLTITTTTGGPYDDSFGEDGLLEYRYRGEDPDHRDNQGLRRAMLDEVPLIYLHSLIPGRYLAVFPVYIVGDDPGALTFTVAADDYVTVRHPIDSAYHDPAPRREYITRSVRQRLHQRGFHLRVLKAYRELCTICRLKHRELLDAAHIIPDSEPDGDPVVQNGLALCKLHHAAYDKGVLGISPDYEVAIRRDVLDEVDGPMLKHGLVGMHGSRLVLPRRKTEWPDRDRLARRFEEFRGA